MPLAAPDNPPDGRPKAPPPPRERTPPTDLERRLERIRKYQREAKPRRMQPLQWRRAGGPVRFPISPLPPPAPSSDDERD